LTLEGKYYRLKTDTWADGAGFSVAQAILIENPLRTLSVVINGTAYNATTDSYVAGTPANVLCFVEPLREDYEFVSPAFESVKPGDKAISLLKAAATVKANDIVGDYKIVSVRDQGTWLTCHGRNIKG
jgi:hypothetical protein